MKYSIIIVSYNKYKILKQTLLSLIEKIKNKDFEIIVIDNASTEDNVGMLKRDFPNIILIKNDVNLGFGKANNIGAEIAQGEFLFFVNGDVIIYKDPFVKMINFYAHQENIGLLGAQLKNKNLSYQPSHYNFPTILRRTIELFGIKEILKKYYSTYKIRNEEFYRVNSIKGAFFCVSKKNFNILGKFDENYFMYIEDIDLSFQSIKKGFQNYLYSNSQIIHLGENHETPQNLFLFENRNKGLIYFFKKNYSKIYSKLYLSINILFFSVEYFINLMLKRSSLSENYRIILLLYLKGFTKS